MNVLFTYKKKNKNNNCDNHINRSALVLIRNAEL